SNRSTAGTQSVIVSPAPSPSRVTPSAPPSRGVVGGVGGGSTDYGTVTPVAGGALGGTGLLGTRRSLRRRRRPARPRPRRRRRRPHRLCAAAGRLHGRRAPARRPPSLSPPPHGGCRVPAVLPRGPVPCAAAVRPPGGGLTPCAARRGPAGPCPAAPAGPPGP